MPTHRSGGGGSESVIPSSQFGSANQDRVGDVLTYVGSGGGSVDGSMAWLPPAFEVSAETNAGFEAGQTPVFDSTGSGKWVAKGPISVHFCLKPDYLHSSNGQFVLTDDTESELTIMHLSAFNSTSGLQCINGVLTLPQEGIYTFNYGINVESLDNTLYGTHLYLYYRAEGANATRYTIATHSHQQATSASGLFLADGDKHVNVVGSYQGWFAANTKISLGYRVNSDVGYSTHQQKLKLHGDLPPWQNGGTYLHGFKISS